MTKKVPDPDTATSPFKLAAEDLDFVRKSFREAAERYTAGIEGDLVRLRALVEEQETKPSAAVLRDVRELSGLLRRLDLRAEKGRRKDLKKVELLVHDLLDIAETW